jgi:hypothetical protein
MDIKTENTTNNFSAVNSFIDDEQKYLALKNRIHPASYFMVYAKSVALVILALSVLTLALAIFYWFYSVKPNQIVYKEIYYEMDKVELEKIVKNYIGPVEGEISNLKTLNEENKNYLLGVIERDEESLAMLSEKNKNDLILEFQKNINPLKLEIDTLKADYSEEYNALELQQENNNKLIKNDINSLINLSKENKFEIIEYIKKSQSLVNNDNQESLFGNGNNNKVPEYGALPKETILFPDGDKYTGETKNAKKHGQGIYVFENGDKYTGEFKDGLRHGQGTYTFSDGNKYIGEWKNATPNGQGEFHYNDGSNIIYEDIWECDINRNQLCASFYQDNPIDISEDSLSENLKKLSKFFDPKSEDIKNKFDKNNFNQSSNTSQLEELKEQSDSNKNTKDKNLNRKNTLDNNKFNGSLYNYSIFITQPKNFESDTYSIVTQYKYKDEEFDYPSLQRCYAEEINKTPSKIIEISQITGKEQFKPDIDKNNSQVSKIIQNLIGYCTSYEDYYKNSAKINEETYTVFEKSENIQKVISDDITTLYEVTTGKEFKKDDFTFPLIQYCYAAQNKNNETIVIDLMKKTGTSIAIDNKKRNLDILNDRDRIRLSKECRFLISGMSV